MARRTKKEALETRAQIIDAAELCFFKKGVAQTSLAEIAQAAGVTRGAIYWHFTNKSELLDALLMRAKTPLQPLDEASRNNDEPDPLGRLHRLLTVIFQQAELDPSVRRINEIIFHKCEYTDEMGDLREHMRLLRHNSDKKLETALHNAIARGQLAANLDVVMAARCVHAYVAGILDQWLLRPEDFSLADRAEQLAHTVLDVLRSSQALLLKNT